ncbi:SDR family oxidoreductase [Nocardioides eburneiflavus]|uniref:SDR family oxidoreductase n=1 Tax=Nocardioides eburneiflavus TaxID=2518372 RepID=A0A4Z1CKA3_9ACTN|nr:SDR family oxidoreductase [Nocardioides eburneiflavus]TGN65053.1 SDR family oxidoreductase [Nocardioides eburneiflavus]
MPITFDLTGKTAVVTGGSRGIGLMAARGLVQAGARVYVVSRVEDACRTAAADLAQIEGSADVIPLAADLATEEGCRKFTDAIAQREESLDILINNAGAAWGAPLEEYPVSGWDKVVDLNLRAPFLLVQALLPLLEAAGDAIDPARVINVGSIDGLRVPGLPTYAYSASKAGVHHLTRVLAVELGPRHVIVNAIAPGPFESRMMAATLESHQERLESTAPLRRIGKPDDIAGTVVFLSSWASSYITGAVIPVDGGINLQAEA